MKQSKFLTVMACFDDKSQRQLLSLQSKLTNSGLNVNTSDVPFHVSLGSYPTDKLESVLQTMESVSKSFTPFKLTLANYSHFNNRVLFLQPSPCEKLSALHNHFDCNFADGYPWSAHVTLLIGDETAVANARDLLGELDKPIEVTVTNLLIGEFFPTKLIKSYSFND